MAVEAMAPHALLQIDPTYEFDAPRYYDFEVEESESAMRTAELWFVRDHTYAPSPFMPKIKKDRSVKLDVLCDFGNDENVQEESDLKIEAPQYAKSDEDTIVDTLHHEEQVIVLQACAPTCVVEKSSFSTNELLVKGSHDSVSVVHKDLSPLVNLTVEDDAKKGKEQKNGSSVRKPSALQLKESTRLLKSEANSVRPKKLPLSSALDGLKSAARSTKKVLPSDIAQENQAIKRQKLEGGKSRQILDVKDRIFPHKSKLVLTTSNDENKDKSQRKMYERDQVKVNPFVSAAEMVQKFHSSTRKIDISCSNKSLSHDDLPAALQGRPALKLTQPKEPELQTSQRTRFVKIKSSAEIEEELLAKMPKFKARPINKKIFDAPKLPPVPPKKTPQLPQFQEFHLKTTERAAQNTEPVFASVSTPSENHSKVQKLTEPKTPRLETSCRARPIKIKTSEELELEELEKVPQFKARPLDKKILEGKGAIGLTRIHKRQLTVPREFNFATDERLLPLKSVEHMFDKLSLNSEPQQQQLPRITTPNPFHLQTEERGMIKEKRLADELLHKQHEEEKARIPKANPYPYTTDIPVIPPKPAPRSCTKPEAFQLESLVRHEEEVLKQIEERERMEKEEARNRLFKAAPIMKEDPVPLPQKERRPLTQVQDFVLHVDHRAVDRSEFDKKINEKEVMYKRYREEYELNQKIEDEKELKQMRRTMVPHARPTPSFANPFLPQKSSKEATKAKSPKLRILQRRRVANISQMR